MTDEKRLHGMMAEADDNPRRMLEDSAGWPAGLVSPRTCDLAERPVDDGQVGMVYRVGCRHGEWEAFEPRRARRRAESWHSSQPTWRPGERAADDSAGTASSSASTSGTGGLAELLARLQAEVQSLADMAQAAADVIEGRRRELWDRAVEATRRWEQEPSPTTAHFASGLFTAYRIVAGGTVFDSQLAAELDSRYGTDRAKGGGPS